MKNFDENREAIMRLWSILNESFQEDADDVPMEDLDLFKALTDHSLFQSCLRREGSGEELR